MQTEMKTQQSLERIFHYQDRCIRTLIREGEPWFVAADVCAVLGLVNPSQAVSYLDDDERCLISNEACWKWRRAGDFLCRSYSSHEKTYNLW